MAEARKGYSAGEVERLLELQREVQRIALYPKDFLGLPRGVGLEELVKIRDEVNTIVPPTDFTSARTFELLYTLIEAYKRVGFNT